VCVQPLRPDNGMASGAKSGSASGSTVSLERRLYRQGSLSSQLAMGEGAGSMPLGSIGVAHPSRGHIGASMSSGSIRSRTPSGKSIKSRTATRAEYHKDLKKELQSQVWVGVENYFFRLVTAKIADNP
jgi:hypothetical protein